MGHVTRLIPCRDSRNQPSNSKISLNALISTFLVLIYILGQFCCIVTYGLWCFNITYWIHISTWSEFCFCKYIQRDECLVLLQVTKCFVPVQIFCVGPKIYLHIVLCHTKRWFAFSKIVFCSGTKVFEEALSAVKFLGWFKKFGPAQNILRPVKGHCRNKLKINFTVQGMS